MGIHKIGSSLFGNAKIREQVQMWFPATDVAANVEIDVGKGEGLGLGAQKD